MPLGPRETGYSVLDDTRITCDGAKALADAALRCRDAISTKDVAAFGKTVRAGYEAQIAMFPMMMNESVAHLIEQYRDTALGWKLSGAGGGGYLILVSDEPIPNSIRVVARRESD